MQELESRPVEVRAGRFEGLEAVAARSDWVWRRMLQNPSFADRRATHCLPPEFLPPFFSPGTRMGGLGGPTTMDRPLLGTAKLSPSDASRRILAA